MKALHFTAAVGILAATSLISLAATGSNDDDINRRRINTITIHSSAYKVDSVFYANDLDSIQFYQSPRGATTSAYCFKSFYDSGRYNSLSSIKGFSFTFLDPGEPSSTSMYCELRDLNRAYLEWKHVPGAASYEIRYIRGYYNTYNFNWNNLSWCAGSVTVSGDSTSTVIKDLDYSTDYSFAIRAVSSEGVTSEWATRLQTPYYQQNYRDQYLSVTTGKQLSMPHPITTITGRTADGFTVNFDLSYRPEDFQAEDVPLIEDRFNISDGKFHADRLIVTDTRTGENFSVALTGNDLEAGCVRVTGLEKNSTYEVSLIDSAITSKLDGYDSRKVKVWEEPDFSEYIRSLGDEYSIFRDLFIRNLDSTDKFADWTYTDELRNATLILPSDEVIREAMDDAHVRLATWNLEREDNALYEWIHDVAFLSRTYSAAELMTDSVTDITGFFGRHYHTDVQRIDTTACIRLSNATVYPLTRLRIPNNVLIYRLKSRFIDYENCTGEQVADFFKVQNIATPLSVYDTGAYHSPVEDVWPTIHYRLIKILPGADGANAPFRLDFTPLRSCDDGTGKKKAEVFMIPPGAYTLAMGFAQQKTDVILNVSVIAGDSVVGSCQALNINNGLVYHYDRGAGDNPEGYDWQAIRLLTGDSKAQYYDRDGGPVIDRVVIPDVNGDGSPVRISLRIEADSWQGMSEIPLYHWCLRPTPDNY